MALMNKIPYYTLITAATAAVKAIGALQAREIQVERLQTFCESVPAADKAA